MIKAELRTVFGNQQIYCSHEKCLYSETLHVRLGDSYRIKPGIVYLYVKIVSYPRIINLHYCLDCIDLLYHDLKPLLDRKLWMMQ